MDELTKSVKNRHNRYNIFIANATNQNESQRKSENLVILKNYMDCTYFSKKPNNVAERYDRTICISYIYFLGVCFRFKRCLLLLHQEIPFHTQPQTCK